MIERASGSNLTAGARGTSIPRQLTGNAGQLLRCCDRSISQSSKGANFTNIDAADGPAAPSKPLT